MQNLGGCSDNQVNSDTNKTKIDLSSSNQINTGLLLSILDQVKELLILLDDENKIIYANSPLCNELGYSCSELSQIPVKYLIATELETLEMEGITQINLRLKCGDNKKYHYCIRKIGRQKLLLLNHLEENTGLGQNKRNRFEKELENAKKIHQANLPQKLPSGQAYSCSAFFRPAEHLGGDYYDIFKVDHGAMEVFFDHLVLVLIDVTGHGLDGAMMSGFLKNTIKGFFTYRHREGVPVDPGKIMSDVYDEYKKAEYPEELFACILIGVCDFTTNKFVYNSSGFQFPGKLVDDNGKISEIELGGLPISTAIDKSMYDFNNQEISFKSGESLFLSTDGLLEQENDCDDSYFHRISNILATADKSPESILNEVICDFDSWLGNKSQEDDITCLAIRHKKYNN